MKTAKAKILLIGKKRTDRSSFPYVLEKKGYVVETVPNGTAAIERLLEFAPDIVIVDAASKRVSGRRTCHAIRKNANSLPIILVTDEPDAVKEKGDANVVLALPFTTQKLINRFRSLLPVEPKDLLQAGPIQLDVRQRVARCETRQVRLTPRLVTLLKILMENPGTVIEREHLFKRVWDTDFTGDTRTLDVHVSWLRQALEADPRHPVFIKTVRGAGYRLDIENPLADNGNH